MVENTNKKRLQNKLKKQRDANSAQDYQKMYDMQMKMLKNINPGQTIE